MAQYLQKTIILHTLGVQVRVLQGVLRFFAEGLRASGCEAFRAWGFLQFTAFEFGVAFGLGCAVWGL